LVNTKPTEDGDSQVPRIVSVSAYEKAMPVLN